MAWPEAAYAVWQCRPTVVKRSEISKGLPMSAIAPDPWRAWRGLLPRGLDFWHGNPPCSTCPHEGKAIDYWHVQIDNDQRRENALNDVEDLPAMTGVFERVPHGKEHFRHKFTNRFLIISRQGSTDCPSPRPSVTRHQSPLLEFTASGKKCTNQRKGLAKQAFIV